MAGPAGRQNGANAEVVGQFPLAEHIADHAERLSRRVLAQGQLIKPTFAQARWYCRSGYQGL